MSEWKDGDEAMVTLYRVHGHLAEVECGDCLRTVHVECLHPLPADPHQELKDAVIEAAKVWRMGPLMNGTKRLMDAIDALTAAQNPPKPDPVEVFYEVARDNLSVCSSKTWKLCRSKPDECACRRYIAEGLAAVEAARGAK